MIDFVVTWVDGNDLEWRKEKNYYSNIENQKNDSEIFRTWDNNEIRYRDWENLKYWFRGIEKYAPWVRKVHFVTWGHVPEWLNLDNPKLNIVKHSDFIPEKYLPTFNSHTIELNLHRIPGLSEHFVYFNDDMFITNKILPIDFFKKGKPCDLALMSTIPLMKGIGQADVTNTGVLNYHFNKNKVIKQNFWKWFSPLYGKEIIRNILLMPWQMLPGIYESHLAIPLCKSTYKEVWNAEKTLLDETCACKFRNNENVSPWLIKNWQIMTGKFVPRDTKLGKMFLQDIDENICKFVIEKKYKITCINDVDCSEESFLKQKKMLNDAFEIAFPEKSSFEK